MEQIFIKVEQIVYTWDLYIVLFHFFSIYVYMQVVLYTEFILTSPQWTTWLLFLLGLHVKNNTPCVIEHISFNSVYSSIQSLTWYFTSVELYGLLLFLHFIVDKSIYLWGLACNLKAWPCCYKIMKRCVGGVNVS